MPRTDALEFEQLESELARALAWQPSPEIVERIDRRVRGVTPSRSPARRWRHPAILLAAAFLLMGAATAALTLVQQAAQYMPGHVVAYDRGERLGLAQRAGDYTITLDRAYGDPNQLVLAFSVAGPRGASPALVRANVVDSSGRSFLEFAGGDATDPETAGSGSILAFDVPPGVAGSVDLTATVTTFMPTATHPPLDPGPPLVYRFSLPFHDATTVTPKLTEAVDGRAITLEWLRVSATATRFRIDTDLTGLKSADHPAWFLEATIRHDRGPEESLTWAAMPPGWTGQAKAEMGALLAAIDGSVVVYQAMSGTDDPSGTWTLSVRRLIGVGGTGGSGQAIVDGPWVFTVNVP